MLSQLNMRFNRDMITRLKNRASAENTSVNALAELFIETGLQTPGSDAAWLRLMEAPDDAVAQLYRQIVAGEIFGSPAPGSAELRFICQFVRKAWVSAHGGMVSSDMLTTLMDITGELLIWQAENGMDIDTYYIKGTLGLKSEDWPTEINSLRSALPPRISPAYAEMLVRPLASGCFPLADFPDDVLAGIFSQSRLRRIFPLVMRAGGWSFETRKAFIMEIRPRIAAQRVCFSAGNLSFEVHVKGSDERLSSSDVWYEPPRLYLVVEGENFNQPFGWQLFADLVRVLMHYRCAPESKVLEGEHITLFNNGCSSDRNIVQLETMRLFMSKDELTALADQLTRAVCNGSLMKMYTSMRCLYGDI